MRFFVGQKQTPLGFHEYMFCNSVQYFACKHNFVGVWIRSKCIIWVKYRFSLLKQFPVILIISEFLKRKWSGFLEIVRHNLLFVLPVFVDRDPLCYVFHFQIDYYWEYIHWWNKSLNSSFYPSDGTNQLRFLIGIILKRVILKITFLIYNYSILLICQF